MIHKPETMNPDCKAGKHHACSGTGWDEHLDDTVACPCCCHTGEHADIEITDVAEPVRTFLCVYCKRVREEPHPDIDDIAPLTDPEPR